MQKTSERGDSRLYFAANAASPNDASQKFEREPNAEWLVVTGGGSTRAISTRLALATPPQVDRLGEILQEASALNLNDARILVASAQKVGEERLANAKLENALFVAATDPNFSDYFQMELDESDEFDD